MLLFFYDTETTDKGPKAEVIQFSGILTDMNLNAKMLINKYCFTNMQIAPDAQNVHQLSIEEVYRLSKGRYLEEILSEELNFLYDEKDIIFIAYNDSFDKRMINQTLKNSGSRLMDFGTKISTLDRSLRSGRYNLCAAEVLSSAINNGIRWKLETYTYKKMGVSREELEGLFRSFCKKNRVETKDTLSHNALFDSFVLWWLFSKYKAMIYT